MKQVEYEEMIRRYEEVGLNDYIGYKLTSVEQINHVYGFDISNIKGMDRFTDRTKSFAIDLIISYINGWGLQARANQEPKSIKLDNDNKRFIVHFKKDSYSYLYFNGSVG